jgi:hypothetical protein
MDMTFLYLFFWIFHRRGLCLITIFAFNSYIDERGGATLGLLTYYMP